jgi:hypothetical protein
VDSILTTGGRKGSLQAAQRRWGGGGRRLSHQRAAPRWRSAHRRGIWAGSRPERSGVAEASAAGEEGGIRFFRLGHRFGDWCRWATEEEGRRAAAALSAGGAAARIIGGRWR